MLVRLLSLVRALWVRVTRVARTAAFLAKRPHLVVYKAVRDFIRKRDPRGYGFHVWRILDVGYISRRVRLSLHAQTSYATSLSLQGGVGPYEFSVWVEPRRTTLGFGCYWDSVLQFRVNLYAYGAYLWAYRRLDGIDQLICRYDWVTKQLQLA